MASAEVARSARPELSSLVGDGWSGLAALEGAREGDLATSAGESAGEVGDLDLLEARLLREWVFLVLLLLTALSESPEGASELSAQLTCMLWVRAALTNRSPAAACRLYSCLAVRGLTALPLSPHSSDMIRMRMSCGGNAVGEGLQSTLTKLDIVRDRRQSHGLDHGRRAECLCPGPLAVTDSQCRVWNADEDGVGEGVSGNAHLLS